MQTSWYVKPTFLESRIDAIVNPARDPNKIGHRGIFGTLKTEFDDDNHHHGQWSARLYRDIDTDALIVEAPFMWNPARWLERGAELEFYIGPNLLAKLEVL